MQKQIGLAMHNYEGTHNMLPSARTISPHHWSSLAQILPFLEGGSLYNLVNSATPSSRNGNDMANRTAVQVLISASLCPIDSSPHRVDPAFGPTNDVANAGNGPMAAT